MDIIKRQLLASSEIIVTESKLSTEHAGWHLRLHIESRTGYHAWVGEVDLVDDEVYDVLLAPICCDDDAFTLSDTGDEREAFRPIANAVYAYMHAAGEVAAHDWRQISEFMAENGD